MIEDLPPLPARDADALALAACYWVARGRARATRLARALSLVPARPCPGCGQDCPCDCADHPDQPSAESGHDGAT
jgi:hypothetical protein